MLNLPAALGALARWPKFIVYRTAPTHTPGKFTKLPCNHAGVVSSAFDPANHSDFATASQRASALGQGYGVGYAFTKDDPFWFVDIDGCLLPSGEWSPIALQLCQVFAGCAIEVSQSGRGLHIIGSGVAPAHRSKNIPLGLEFYTEDRFVALTGTGAMGDAAYTPAAGLLEWLVESYFSGSGTGAEGGDWTNTPCPDWNGPEDDAELIRRACNSHSARNAFGASASFRDLWTGDVDALAKAYPDSDPASSRAYDASSADAALASHLAFWTGRNCDRILNLMRQSALARDKWSREDYLARTIQGACGRNTAVLSDKQVESPIDAELPPSESGYEPAEMRVRKGASFLNPEQQAQLFKGCVYISSENRVLVEGGRILKPEQFRVVYGGYTFAMDQANEKVSRDAWEAFTQSQIVRPPIVDRTAFRPACPPGAIIREPGRTVVNTFWPVQVARKVGDVTPFIRHLELILPDERDRTIALSYMAAIVQNQGIKFQWAILLQGVQGNGKTLLARCVAEAIGLKYTFWPDAAGLESDFNGWLERTIFVGVEEIKVAEHQAKMIEKLKVMITAGHGIQIQSKGVDQDTKDICANFIFTTNHKAALPLDENDRRFCVFYTAHQHVNDLVRDGIDKTSDYFPNLYEWLRADGYAIVAEFLHTFPIPAEFNPAGACQRAPDTTSTREAIKEGASRIEQEIQEAIEQGMLGFKGGFISSKALDTLLRDLRISASYSRRRDVLIRLGYVSHPGLPDGRSPYTVLPDGMKPRLFVLNGSPASALRGPRVIIDAYAQAQTEGAAAH